MEKVSIEKATEDLKEIFAAVSPSERKESEHLSWYETRNGEATFYIDKKHYDRGKTINLLQNYFSDKVVDGGYCSIDPITFVWTTFKLKKFD